MAQSNANDVKILVKNVYVPTETQQFVVVDSLSIRSLKEMIATALPGNPLPKHQKLIFGGKICHDDSTLAKVLAGQNKEARDDAATDENAAPFVFLLMVSSRSRPPTPEAPRQQRAELPVPATTPPETRTTEPAPTPVENAMPVPPQPAPHAPGASGFPFMGFFGAAPATAAAAPQHGNNHHQHLYTQALLMQQQAMVLAQIQYLQQLQAAAAQAGANPTAAAAPPAAHGMYAPYRHFGHPFAHAYGAAYGHAAHAGAHIPGFPAAPAPGAHVPGAPVPPAEVPAAAEPRDRGPIVQAFCEILPLFDIRLAMKMTFMLFIIGQDTPTDRLIVLALMSFGAYLHITGIIAKVFEILKRSRAAEGGDANANADAGANAANPNGAPNAQGRLGSITRHLRISADRGFVHDVRYFITGLFLSLVPAWHPQPLNVDMDAAAPQPPMAEAGPELPLQGI